MMVLLGMTYEGIEKSVPAPIYFSEAHRTPSMVYLWNISACGRSELRSESQDFAIVQPNKISVLHRPVS